MHEDLKLLLLLMMMMTIMMMTGPNDV